MTFRINTTLWSRPDAPTAPEQFSALWWGWLIKGDNRRPFIVRGAPVVFIGAQYVMPIAYDGSAFSAIQPFAAFRFHQGVVTPEEQDTPLAQAMMHASRSQVVDLFANAAPDALAVRYRHLPPRQRLAAVLAARHPTETQAARACATGVNRTSPRAMRREGRRLSGAAAQLAHVVGS